MKHIVGISDMKWSNGDGDIIVTHALGSCIGIAVYDTIARIGAILHYMLPTGKVDKMKAESKPYMFGDIAIPALFNELYKNGAVKENIRVVMAGGAQVFERKDFFAIGKRNVVIARKMFWKNNIMISAEHVGGTIPRTMYLDINSGQTWLTSNGERVDL